MKSQSHCVAVVGILLLVHATAVAPAAPVSSLVPVPISPEAIAADPALADYQTWDLRVTIEPGRIWYDSGIEFSLTQGSFYQPPLGSRNPLPQTWGAFPHLRYDTFVTQPADPNDDSTFIAPNNYSGFGGPLEPIVFDETRLSIVWAFTPFHHVGNGTYTVARLTFTNDAVGSAIGYHEDNFSFSPFAFTVPVPEPALPGCTVAALGLALRRRRGAGGAG